MTAPQDPFSNPPRGDTPPQPPPPPAGYGAPAGPPAGYGAPAYGQQPGAFGAPGGFGGHTAPRNGFGVAALVLGLLSLFTGLFVIGGLFGLVAIILGVMGRGRAKRGEATNGGMALAGIILGALGLLLTIALVAGVATFLNSDTGQDLQDCLAQAGGDQAAIDQCSREFEDSVTG